jgi:hypothetical protein
VRIRSILRWTNTYHLWHPTDITVPASDREARNAAYLNRKGSLIRCRNGLAKRSLEDLRLRLLGNPPTDQIAQWLPALMQEHPASADPAPEVEVVFLPGPGRFSGRAECNVLVVNRETPAAVEMAKQAHIVVADCELPVPQAFYRFRLHELSDALKAVA